MQALYLDTIDMNCINRSAYNQPEEVAVNVPGPPGTAIPLPVPPRPPSLFEEATELYQVFNLTCLLINVLNVR